MSASDAISPSRYSSASCSIALGGGGVLSQAASTSAIAPALRPRWISVEVFIASSLLDPVLPVTKRDDAAQLGERSTTLLTEVIKVGLSRFKRALAGAAAIDNAVTAQKSLDILCEQEGVDAEGAERKRPRITAQSAAVLSQIQPQADHVVGGPSCHEFAKGLPLSPLGVVDHHGVLAHGFDLAEVADDGRVLGLTLQHVVGHHQEPLHVELPEHLFELGPLFVDHAPHKARLKNLAGELGQVTIRTQLFEMRFAFGLG